jgi:hypothetical protein
MDETTFYDWLVIAWIALAVVTFIALFFVNAPYGRFTRGLGRMCAAVGLISWNPLAHRSWCYRRRRWRGNRWPSSSCSWVAHYLHRSFIYPFRLRSSRPDMTVSVIAMGAAYNLGNGYLNARYLFTLGPDLQVSWLLDPRFIFGFIIFWLGYALNQHSDRVLIGLRKGGDTGYRIPYGGGYRFVSCPNYLGEMVEWGGWALACWNPGATAFFIWTVANLAPRAIMTHRWYRDRFPDYPGNRKALIPFVL